MLSEKEKEQSCSDEKRLDKIDNGKDAGQARTAFTGGNISEKVLLVQNCNRE